MILTCPQCSTRYQTEASQFVPTGRKVRCAKCGHVWHQAPPAPDPEPDIELAPLVPQRPVESAAQRSAYAPSTEFSVPAAESVSPPAGRLADRLGIAAGWAGLAGIVLAIGWSAVGFRQEIATLWPQSSSLYSALGMKVNARGLAFADIVSRHETEDGQSVLAVTGRLVNVSTHELSVPPIRITLTDKDKRVLYNWSFSANVATLRPGQTINFVTRMSSPPLGTKHLQLQLAESGE